MWQRKICLETGNTCTQRWELQLPSLTQSQVEKAMEIFQDMSLRGCERNVITYSSLISACEKVRGISWKCCATQQWPTCLQLILCPLCFPSGGSLGACPWSVSPHESGGM
jgi:hypothetical protein